MARTTRRNTSVLVTTIGRDLILLTCLITLIISSSLTIDAFNPIKFAVMVLGVFYIYVRYWRYINLGLNLSKNLAFLVFTFLAHSFLILTTNSYSISERLFGIQGRFFGLISILALSLLGCATYLVVKDRQLGLDFFFRCLLFTNLIVNVVFLIQKYEIAFLAFENPYAVLPSTLGNPNFLAAFVASSVFSAFYFLINPRTKSWYNLLLALMSIFASLVTVLFANSLQGPLGILVGILFLIFAIGIQKSPKTSIIIATIFLLASIPIAQGLFGRGFFGETFVQSTLVFRSLYWKIAIRISIDSPVFGYGFDSYLDNFRKFRSSEEVRRYGTGIISDSPHNLFLDFLVAGGFPYLLWVIVGSIYVVFAAIKTLELMKSRKEENREVLFLFTIWIVLFILSLINPFQISVNVWIVVIGFLIVGRYHELTAVNREVNSWLLSRFLTKSFIRVTLSALLVCFANPPVASLALVKEIRLRSAIERSNYESLRDVSRDWPFSGSRVADISQGIVSSTRNLVSTTDLELERQLQQIIRFAYADALSATKINGESFELWNFLFFNHPDPLIKEEARVNLLRLDPHDSRWLTANP